MTDFSLATDTGRSTPPVLYILMRDDLPDLNAGKAVAQGSHAANQCLFEGTNLAVELSMTRDPALSRQARALDAMLSDWEEQTDAGFGTCIVLSASEHEMHACVSEALEQGLHAGITHDPSYPLRPRRPSLRRSTSLLAAAALLNPIGLLGLSRASYTVMAVLLNATVLSAVFDDLWRFWRAWRTPADRETVPIDTCAYVFGRRYDVAPIVSHLCLMR